MPTHQELGGGSDEDLLRRMIETHADRFGDAFWSFYRAGVAPLVPPRPVIVDLGCGPGLLLRDLGERHPGASLVGYDVTPAMVDHARGLAKNGAAIAAEVRDLAAGPLPEADGAAHLVSLSSVLHVLDEPLPVLAEVRRILAPRGLLLLNDWIRQPLEVYLAFRRDAMQDAGPGAERRAFRLFPAQNKYTAGDWRWLLAHSGFAVRHEAQLRPSHRIFVAVRE